VRAGEERGYKVVLEEERRQDDTKGTGRIYKDTLLPLEPLRGNYRKDGQVSTNYLKGSVTGKGGVTGKGSVTGRAADGAAAQAKMQGPAIPPRILDMMKLYEYGSSSFEHKCRNFFRQGKFMEDYEDDYIWNGELRRYFTTYHDLNLNQLRGFFGWRTRVRRGEFRRITTSLAYMYIYELLNGIGAADV
jgi:hypothetical protein